MVNKHQKHIWQQFSYLYDHSYDSGGTWKQTLVKLYKHYDYKFKSSIDKALEEKNTLK